MIVDNLSRFATAKLVPTWIDLMGLEGTFYLYSICTLFVGIGSFIWMPETAGMSLEEIQKLYQQTVEK